MRNRLTGSVLCIILAASTIGCGGPMEDDYDDGFGALDDEMASQEPAGHSVMRMTSAEACQECSGPEALSARCLTECPRCDDGVADGCWPGSPSCDFDPAGTDLVVGTINLHNGGRVAEAATYVLQDWLFGSAIYALQETKGKSVHFARVACERLEERTGVPCQATAFDKHNLGVVSPTGAAAGQWVVESTKTWKLGNDRLGICVPIGQDCGRYLVEVLFKHQTRPWRFRFYSTHLSHNSSKHGSQGGAQLEQVERLVEIVESRVGVGELPPIVAGDFNLDWTNQDYNLDDRALQKMSNSFTLVNRGANRCGTRVTEIDHVWVGKPCSFRKTRGEFNPLRLHRVPLHGASDHDAFVVNLRVRDSSPACTPSPAPVTNRRCCERDDQRNRCTRYASPSGQCP